jgi:16S rRNA (adenine1518-N6/adenine1519-N6)-dimethyltransferase
MSEEKFTKKKSLGQNFLKSKPVIKNIVRAGEVGTGDMVLEVGPGKGDLTEALLEAGARIIAVEKDDRLIPILKEKFEKEIASNQLTLIHTDILNVDLEKIMVGSLPFSVIANIPYYITGQLFRLFLEGKCQPMRMVVLVQKEVAIRIVARNGRESILSLSVKAYGIPEMVAKVSRKLFSPQPGVDSAILLVKSISKNFFSNFSEEKFFEFVHAGFAQKRKKLIRNLERVSSRKELSEIFKNLGLDENLRAENLKLADWRNLLDQEPK